MRVVAHLQWEELGYGSPLWRAHAAGRLTEAWRAPDFRDLRPFAARPGVGRDFLDDLLAEMQAGERPPWEALGAPGALAVVTGQQPGCAGGVLLTLYKAATAVALARRAARHLDRPCVPVFWNAGDDADFDEIARVGWPDRERGLLFLELAGGGRQAAGWIGDLPAALDEQAADAALALVDAGARQALRALLPGASRDHAHWVAELLGRVFPDLAVLDARSAALRRHGAALFARHLQMHAAARRAVEARAEELVASGYARTLSPATDWLGLFVTREGRRVKVGDDPQPLRQALERAPESMSPNVILRPLLQDLLLPTLAHVVGPSEVGYLLELRPLRSLLEVPEPALWPRLGLTLLEEEAWQAAERLRIDTAALLGDPEAALAATAARRTEAERRNIDAAFADLERALEQGARAALGAAVARARRGLGTVRGELLEKLAEVARQDLLGREPALAFLPAVVRPRHEPQERLVAALWLLARWGGDTGERLVTLAEAHLQALDAARATHLVVTL